MNRAEAFAKYWHYNEEIIVVPVAEFYQTMQNNIVGLEVKHCQPLCDVEMMEWSIDGWDYVGIGVIYNAGYGEKDCDSFKYKIKRMTAVEREEMMKILSHQNVFNEDELPNIQPSNFEIGY